MLERERGCKSVCVCVCVCGGGGGGGVGGGVKSFVKVVAIKIAGEMVLVVMPVCVC